MKSTTAAIMTAMQHPPKRKTLFFISFVTIQILGFALLTCAFQVTPRQRRARLSAKKDQGYKFGDFTKGLAKKITGKQDYQFGDVSRHLDKQAKDAINRVTGKDEYQFGDLSRWTDAQVKEKLTIFTGKETYQVGDVSKEIIRRVQTGEYTVEDLVLLCKVLLTFGVGLTPVANALPAKLLIQMMEVSVAEQVGEKVVGALAKTLDERMKKSITGDANYQLGDKTKQVVKNLVGRTMSTSRDKKKLPDIKEMDAILQAELDDWDRRLGIGGDSKSSSKKG